MIDSHVPPAAGLSSSSAFVVCTSLLASHANNLIGKIEKKELSERCVLSERSAGTACGGMDQTISIFAEMNTAKLIEFNPTLKASDVHIPSTVSLVIANSLTPSPKLLTVGTRYNKRVVECKFGLMIMAVKAGLASSAENVKFATFYQLQTALGYTFQQMLDLTDKHLVPKGYSHE